VLYINGQDTVKLSDGTSITFDGSKYLHLDSNGRILHVVKKGERPSSGFWGGVSMALNFFTANVDQKGEHMHRKYPLAAERLRTEEELKDWRKKVDEFYERNSKP
jgi:hypothetical protein